MHSLILLFIICLHWRSRHKEISELHKNNSSFDNLFSVKIALFAKSYKACSGTTGNRKDKGFQRRQRLRQNLHSINLSFIMRLHWGSRHKGISMLRVILLFNVCIHCKTFLIHFCSSSLLYLLYLQTFTQTLCNDNKNKGSHHLKKNRILWKNFTKRWPPPVLL